MTSDDVWKSSDASPVGVRAAGQRFQGGELPNLGAMISELLSDLMGNFGGWLSLGVGNLLMAVVAVVLIVPPYLMTVLPMLNDSDATLMLPGLVLLSVAVVFVSLLQLPLTNGQYRALLRYQRGEAPLGVSAPFGEAATGLGTVFALTLVIGGLSMLAVMACYLPVFLLSAMVGLAFPAVVVHRVGALSAVALSMRHARQYPTWTLGFWAIGFAMVLVGSQIPLVGTMLTTPLYIAFHLRAYRQIFGDGDEPVEQGVT
jgi:uncharacterized membrane protein